MMYFSLPITEVVTGESTVSPVTVSLVVHYELYSNGVDLLQDVRLYGSSLRTSVEFHCGGVFLPVPVVGEYESVERVSDSPQGVPVQESG